MTKHANEVLAAELKRRGLSLPQPAPDTETNAPAAFDPSWRVILSRRVPFYNHLPSARRARFERKLAQFVRTKKLISVGDLVVTEEMKVIIAATACWLIINLLMAILEPLRYVKVHPRPFHDSTGTLVMGLGCREYVEIAWSEVRHGISNDTDGQNVGYHEFAHVLDELVGVVDGAPVSFPLHGYGIWAPATLRGTGQFLSPAPFQLQTGTEEETKEAADAPCLQQTDFRRSGFSL